MMCIFRDMTKPGRPRAGRVACVAGAFTLIELLVSMTVLAILLLLTTQVISQMQKGWMQTASRTSQFREARTAFDLITHNLSQAVLNPYWETDQGGLSSATYVQRTSSGTGLPTKYLRKSDLQFILRPCRLRRWRHARPGEQRTHPRCHEPSFQRRLFPSHPRGHPNLQLRQHADPALWPRLLCGVWGRHLFQADIRPSLHHQQPLPAHGIFAHHGAQLHLCG